MIVKIVHYRLMEGKLPMAKPAIEAFVEAIAREEPETRYEAFQSEDELSFVHLMTFPDQQAEQTHQQAPYTLEFVEVLYPNCQEAPVFTDLSLVKGAYGS